MTQFVTQKTHRGHERNMANSFQFLKENSLDMTTSAELNQQLISAVKAGKIHAAMKENSLNFENLA